MNARTMFNTSFVYYCALSKQEEYNLTYCFLTLFLEMALILDVWLELIMGKLQAQKIDG